MSSVPENESQDSEDPESSDNDEVEDEEFSLDQLSQAYAEVLKSRNDGPDLDEEDEATGGSGSDDLDSDDAAEDPVGKGEGQADLVACPISPESIVESILFVGAPKGEKLTSRKIAALLRDVSPKEVTKIVRDLNQRYEKENAAYRLESDGGVFKMILDPALVGFQQEFFGRNKEVRLSQSAIDVMAVVAYNQPVTRDQVDTIRGKPSGGVLSQLVRRELLKVEPGKTDSKVRYYSTTERFLDIFQLEEIADLPQSHEVSDIEELAD
jgi:segregation and condensation protein B